MKPLTVNCEKHGEDVSASLCGHLVKNPGPAIGFIENSTDPNDLQAWCDACESLFVQEQEITEKFKEFHSLKIVCVICYQEIKDVHSINT